MHEKLDKIHSVTEQVNKIILGKKHEVREILLAILAGGHVLMEDIPGVGKTTMALAFSHTLSLSYKRVQFTPDVMPSDLTGFSIYKKDEERFVYQPGAVFCNLLLADEINRTSPKTQSALLEVMEEYKVTVDGVTRTVEKPFHVIATQNPQGSAGTQSLPEAQMDRFMILLSLGYPDYDSELAMAKAVSAEDKYSQLMPVLTKETLSMLQNEIYDIYISDGIYRYILDLVTATRNNPYLEKGASPRATISLVKMAKSSAWYEGRDYVLPSDVSEQFGYVTAHRVTLTAAAKVEKLTKHQVLEEICKSVRRPPLGE